ncbi:hypothetical protein F4779DRAFT_623776 [Xylariaceae sp. FL0662B]|nr:hypothetical protein F4779DRAFT_623776 [Xylariaceae sp. FL0662B]
MPPPGPSHHRFSNFDSQLFALGPNSSPAQAKRALEAHLAETERRMAEAGKLGTALVQQRNELTERLKDVEKLEAEGELSTDLRQKLVEIEKDYNEVAKESARAFLPKQRVPSNEAAAGSPFVPEGKGGRRSVSPSKFEAQATGSPSKFSVPNRKVRNQPANRIHDIEFAAEISTSLIAQVRNLQGLLSEKEEELRDLKVEKSKLEYDAEGFQQRLKALDESENRYKDENWNLETQIHDLMAKERDAADREKKLTQSLNILQAEKNATQRELDELKLSQSKLIEEHAAAVKHHDIELGTAKRNIVTAESERASMARRIEDLTGQNQELAKAVSASQRMRIMERESILGMSDEDFETARDKTTPEHSPPPSPVKRTPQHSMLEAETLKTSLGHAQRTIQGLRNNVHREKTEKLELKRMLQEARDDLEKLRHDPLPTSKRTRKADTKEYKKPPPRLLGALRNTRSEVFSDDPNWEDQTDSASPAQSSLASSIASRGSTKFYEPLTEISDHFETANETSDAAFETANEPATETDDFHTGAEEFSSDDAETETESPSKRSNFSHRNRTPSLRAGLTRKGSVQSTASTEDEDFPYDNQMRTPTSLPPPHQKFPLRVARGAFRRSRQASEEPALQSSPASFQNSSRLGTPQQPGQSLAAELGDFETSDNESNLSATPSKRSVRGRTLSIPPLPPLPKMIMVDSGTMTEDPIRPMSMGTVVSRLSTSSNDSTAQDTDDKLGKFPSPPTSPRKKDIGTTPELALSNVHSHEVEPQPESDTHAAELAALRAEHSEQLKQLSAENATAHAAVLEALEIQHKDHLSQAQAEAQTSHAEELESLKAKHADEISKAVAQVQSAHDQEIELLRTKYADDANKSAVEAQEAHVQELETLRSTHENMLSRTIAEAQAAHTAELEALKLRHADEANKAAAEAEAAYAQQLDVLKSSHSDEISKSVAEVQAAHAQELESLKSSHADEIGKAIAETQLAHAAELEALKSSHADEISRSIAEAQEAHAQELEASKASFAEQMSQKELDNKEASAHELEAVKSAHAEQLAQRESEIKAAHDAELEVLRNKHADELSTLKRDTDAGHAAEIAALTAVHSAQIEEAKRELSESHVKDLETLKAGHAEQLDRAKQNSDAAYSEQIEALKATHLQQIQQLEEAKATMRAAHSQEIESLNSSHIKQIEGLRKDTDAAHAAEIAALVASHSKEIESSKAESEAKLSRELAALKEAHAQEIDSLNSQHAVAHAEELKSFKAALDKQIESSKTEGDAAHTQQIEALNAAHAEIIDAHKRDSEKTHMQAIESLKAAHERQIEALKSENTASRSKELDDLASQHLKELDALRTENKSSRVKLMEELAATHSQELEDLRKRHEAAKSDEITALSTSHEEALDMLKKDHEALLEQKLRELTNAHELELEGLRQQSETTKSESLAALLTAHAHELDEVKKDHAAAQAQKLQELADDHSRELEGLRQESENAKSEALAALVASHAQELQSIRDEYDAARLREVDELKSTHIKEVEELRSMHAKELESLNNDEAVRLRELKELKSTHANELDALRAEHEAALVASLENAKNSHVDELESLRSEYEAARLRELEELRSTHAEVLAKHELARSQELEELKTAHATTTDSLQAEHQSALNAALEELKADHAKSLDALQKQRDISQAEALETLGASHSQQLDQLKSDSEAILARELEAANASHAAILESHKLESAAEKKKLMAEHAAELEALRESLTLVPPVLGISSLRSIETEPIEAPEPRSSRSERPQTPPLGRKGKSPSAVVIAEDDTRQSPSAVAGSETPESQRPFKEISTNTDARPSRKQVAVTSDRSSQTALTSDSLDRLVKNQHMSTVTPFDEAAPSSANTVRIRRPSQESLGSVPRSKQRMSDSGAVSAPEPIPPRRPGSSASARGSVHRPPLPSNHLEVIEAARTGSSGGGKGTMGPPPLPTSSYRNPASQPQTPSGKRPMSPLSVKDSTTPRGSRLGYANVNSPTRIPVRSRHSSVSSFASEIDLRFGNRGDMNMDAAGFGPGTDPRMIQAITQTMIGEYLWKYTRKAGRGEMSENRHRRYFWVHPYTRTLYWSDRDPSAAGRSELKAKSVPIEAVRIVTDDNPMPPGLHRKSLIIISPGRTIKFTCTTGQRHETWFNALSYLLLRTGETQTDVEEVAGNITQEDVEEFNPSFNRRPANINRTRAPPSLSSYNSRTTRNESPNVEVSMSIPTLTPTHEREAARSGTLGRISGYWRSSTSTLGGTFNSLRSRSHNPQDSAIYEASEVHDSAEDLRHIIEQQDRESDRLENVRACCDGKHDVGTLSHTKRGRLSALHSHSHSHTHPTPPATTTPTSTLRSRG